MTESAFAYPTTTPPPRHFWRRAVAFLVDLVLFYTVIGLISIAVYGATGWNLQLIRSQTTTCEAAPASDLTRQVENEWPLSSGETRVNLVCTMTGFMIPDQRFFISTVNSFENGATNSRSASVAVDRDGNAVRPDPASAGSMNDMSLIAAVKSQLRLLPIMLLFIVIVAQLTARRRRTPGKALMSVRIVDATAATPTLRRALKRESFKFLPAVVLNILLSVLILQSRSASAIPADADFSTVIRAARDIQFAGLDSAFRTIWIASALMALWWFGPFFVWRGQTFYDRLSGCFVVRPDTSVR